MFNQRQHRLTDALRSVQQRAKRPHRPIRSISTRDAFSHAEPSPPLLRLIAPQKTFLTSSKKSPPDSEDARFHPAHDSSKRRPRSSPGRSQRLHTTTFVTASW
ncbi:hypothetical protein TraAM80_09978, partial [Trypanosoma rangeli]